NGAADDDDDDDNVLPIADKAIEPPKTNPVSLQSRQNEPPADLLDRALVATGLASNTSNIQNIRIGGSHFRTRSIALTLSLNSMDRVVVPYGTHTMTYDYSGSSLMQRIDKIDGLGGMSPVVNLLQPPALWAFARPRLDPMDYSLVIRGGSDGFAAVVRGSFDYMQPSAPPAGLLDGSVAAVFIRDSYKWNPLLLQQVLRDYLDQQRLVIKANGRFDLRYEEIEDGFRIPAVYDQVTGLSVLFDADTYLPYLIRSYEDHTFFGPSTNDLRVYNYTKVNNIMVPNHYKVIYNNRRLITDFLADDIAINPSVPAGFFDAPGNLAPQHVPVVDDSITALLGEQLASYIWPGTLNLTLGQLDVQQPFADMPGVWVIRLAELAAVRQVLLEMDDYVIVLDAPPEQAALLLEWSMQVLGKPIKQVWPTHHHHDHASGVRTYVQAGVEIVVPEVAKGYYSKIPGAKFQTYKYNEPYVVETAGFRATYIHLEGSMHAVDYAFGVIMPPCPTNDSSVLVFDADHVIQAERMPIHDDHTVVDEIVTALAKYRVAKSAVLVPAHGAVANLTYIYGQMGRRLPEYTPLDFEYLPKKCTPQ
ncbi:hypothetical protein J1614_001611, partial [Plenodomus biglobosus]